MESAFRVERSRVRAGLPTSLEITDDGFREADNASVNANVMARSDSSCIKRTFARTWPITANFVPLVGLSFEFSGYYVSSGGTAADLSGHEM